MKESLAASGSTPVGTHDVKMASVAESTAEQEDEHMDIDQSMFITPVKKQHAADHFGVHRHDMAPPSTTSTTSDAASPSSRFPLFSSSPMEQTPPQGNLPSPPDHAVTSSEQTRSPRSLRISARQKPKRAVSSIITSADFESTPHGLQQLFIAPVKPSTTDSSQLLAPFSLEQPSHSSGRKSKGQHGDSPEIVVTGEDESDKEDDTLEAPIARRKKARMAERDSARSRLQEAPSIRFDGALGSQATNQASAERLASPFEETS
jgi:hypothetical protein